MSRSAVAVVCALIAVCATAFYIPGINPVVYKEGAIVNILVNGLHSLEALVPYDYYDAPFFRPTELRSRHETIGEMLSGDNQKSSPYYVNMGVDAACMVLTCQNADRVMTRAKTDALAALIDRGYRGYMVIDNLPVFNNGSAVFQGRCANPVENYPYLRGYAIGVSKKCTGKDALLNNHLDFRIQFHRITGTEAMTANTDVLTGGLVEGEVVRTKKYNEKKNKDGVATSPDDQFLVVGFTAEPFSVKWPAPGSDGAIPGCNEDFNPRAASVKPLTINDAFGTRVSWTYSVTWEEEPDIHWASRWDTYLHTSVADVNNKIHWMSIINTVLIVLCLSSMVALVILRSLKKDLARYNAFFDLTKEEQLEAQKEEGGWKVVHGDVFRTPRRAQALTILTASGVQLLAMTACTLTVACLGFLSPANRGGLMTALLFIFIIQACFAGYFAARMHVKLGGEPRNWIVIFYTGIFLPSVVFSVFISVNFILKSVRSSGAVSLGSLMILLAMWIFVALPLVFIGASFGFRVVPDPPARKVNSIPRPVDEAAHPFYLQTGFVVLTAGIIPFAALFLELKFILASLWQGMVYYVFGFLAAVFVLWIVTTALVAMVVVYYRLCAENYQWWWVSFLAPTSLGLNLFLFFVYYFNTQLSIQSTAATYIFYLYMSLVTFFYVLSGGAIGFLSTWLFVHVIYNSVKID